jgi:hypothetical protein
MQFDLLISTRNLGHAQYEQLNYSSSLLQRIINGWVLCDSEGIGLLVSSKHTPSQSPNSYQVAAPATNDMVTWASVEIAKKLLKSEANHISTGLTSNIVYNTMFHHIQYHYYWKGKLKLIITDEVNWKSIFVSIFPRRDTGSMFYKNAWHVVLTWSLHKISTTGLVPCGQPFEPGLKAEDPFPLLFPPACWVPDWLAEAFDSAPESSRGLSKINFSNT